MKKNKLKIIILPVALVVMFFGNSVHAHEVTGTLGTGTTTSTTLSGTVVYPPSANPDSGSYPNSQTVTLSASGADSIYYTTDGTAPTCGTGTIFSNPIPLTSSSNITIQAISCYGSTSSTVKTFTYTTFIGTTHVENNGGGGTTTNTTTPPTSSPTSTSTATSTNSSTLTGTVIQATSTQPNTTSVQQNSGNTNSNNNLTISAIPEANWITSSNTVLAHKAKKGTYMHSGVINIEPTTPSTTTGTSQEMISAATSITAEINPDSQTASVAQSGFGNKAKPILIGIVILGIVGGAVYVNYKKENVSK